MPDESHSPKVIGWRALQDLGKIAQNLASQPPPGYSEGYPFIYHLSYGVIYHILEETVRRARSTHKPLERTVKEWLNKWITPTDPKSTAPQYLRSHWDSDTYHLHVGRMIDLAELLYNLQTIPGIHERFYELLTAPKQIEDKLFELQGFKILCLAKIPFRVKPTGYECDFTLPDGTMVHCEMKCKIETTKFSTNTIRNAFKIACKQLPKDKINIVFLKVPTDWLQDSETFITFFDFLAKEVASRSSITEVVLYSHVPTGGREAIFLYELLNDRSSPYAKILDYGYIKKRMDSAGPWWVSFNEFTTLENLTRRAESEIEAFRLQTESPENPDNEDAL